MTASDVIALVASAANIGLLTGIFFKLGALGQSLVDVLRRIETLEKGTPA